MNDKQQESPEGDVQQSEDSTIQNGGDPKTAVQKRREELSQRDRTFGHAAGTQKRG